MGITIDSVELCKPGVISKVELQLGLKVNHMKTIDLEKVEKNVIQMARLLPSKYANYFANALYDVSTKTSSIFCMRSEYHGQPVLPVWSFYLLGHGNMKDRLSEGALAHIKLDDFKMVLDFFEHKINTKLLVYSTCYGAGTNAEIIYKDSMSAIQKTYSFAIITEAITDAPTEGAAGTIEYDRFLEEATKPGPINYEKAMKYVCLRNIGPRYDPIAKKHVPGRIAWGNVPQIKFSGMEWFSVLESQKNIVQIGSVLAQARDPQKPLNVIKFFNTDPKGILLHAKEVPFELVINSVNMDAIISMIPGDAIHKIKKITSNRATEEVMDWFMKIEMLDSFKIFFLEEINDVKNVLIYNKKISSLPLKYGLYAFFEKNGAFYIKKKSKKSKACTQDQKIKYDELLAQAHKKIKVQEKIDQLGSSTLSTQAEVDLLPSLSDVYSIEQIENGAVGITAIVNYLLGITNAEIAWIKEIRALRGDIKVLGGDQTDIVSVKDFIIDRKQRKYFFTYNNNFYCEEVPYDESSGLYDKINYDYRNDYIPRIVAVHEERKHRKL